MYKDYLEKTVPITPPPSRWQRAKKYIWRFFVIFILVGFILTTFSYLYLKSFESKVNKGSNVANAKSFLSPRLPGEREVNVLLVGTDKREKNERGRADTIILLSLRPREKKVVLLSIPRDMRVKVPGHGRTKINHAYAYGGAPLLIQTVSNFLDIKIHHYAITDFQGFADIVDTLGGVDIYVEKRLYDPQHKILIEPGWRHMRGSEALKYVRFRHDAQGDFGRIKRQQKFFQAIFSKAASIGSIWKIPSLVSAVAEHLETDMSVSEMISLARTYLSIEKDDIQMAMLPGYPKTINGISYVIPEEGKISEIMYWVREKGEIPSFLKEDLTGVSVKVLNGCGEKGWARKVSKHLKSVLKVRVVSIGDAESSDLKGTVIQFKSGSEREAGVIKDWLGFGHLEEKEDLKVDVVIILGKDSLSKLEGRVS